MAIARKLPQRSARRGCSTSRSRSSHGPSDPFAVLEPVVVAVRPSRWRRCTTRQVRAKDVLRRLVIVRKAGDVIPEVVSAVSEPGRDESTVEVPTLPDCGSARTRRDESDTTASIRLSAQQLQQIVHFAREAARHRGLVNSASQTLERRIDHDVADRSRCECRTSPCSKAWELATSLVRAIQVPSRCR